MGIDTLRKEIESEAKRQAAGMKEEAEKEAWHVVHAAEEERKKLVEQAKLDGQAVAKEEERRVSSAKLRAKHTIAEAKEATVVKALDEAALELKEFVLKKEYAQAFNNLARAALEELGDENAVIECRKEDEPLAKKLGKTVRIVPCTGGAAAVTSDGKVRVSNTFESLLELKRDELKKKAFVELFGEQNG